MNIKHLSLVALVIGLSHHQASKPVEKKTSIVVFPFNMTSYVGVTEKSIFERGYDISSLARQSGFDFKFYEKVKLLDSNGILRGEIRVKIENESVCVLIDRRGNISWGNRVGALTKDDFEKLKNNIVDMLPDPDRFR